MFWIFLIEWIASFFVIWGLNVGSNYLFRRKCNPMTSAILSFILVGIAVFIVAPYVLTFHNPAVIYLPILLFWLVMNLIRANKEMNR